MIENFQITGKLDDQKVELKTKGGTGRFTLTIYQRNQDDMTIGCVLMGYALKECLVLVVRDIANNQVVTNVTTK